MTWRTLVWQVLVIGGFVVFLFEIVQGFSAPAVIGTTVAFVLAGILFQTFDGYISGIGRRARSHFGRDWRNVIEVTKPIPEREWFNVYQAMWEFKNEQNGPEPIGIQPAYSYSVDEDPDDPGPSFRGSLLTDVLRANERIEQLQYRTLAAQQNRTLRIATNAVFLLRLIGNGTPFPFAVSLRSGQLVVVAKDEDQAQRAIQWIEQKSQRVSVYRGHVLTCKAVPKREFRIEFVDSPVVDREQLILPSQVVDLLDRNVLQVLKHAAELRRFGRNLQHGVLLYGPPGTGKSLAVRYLINAAKPVTVVNVTGRQMRLIRESCRLARLLAPSLIVLEDIDLIATDRAQSRRTMLLHDLLDEMDVTATNAPVVFLMTTNRPEVIEQALALRPGRINQAIQFSLPDEDCRLRLLQHYFQGVDTTGLDLAAMVARSHGTSAAFIEEWVRRSALFAIGRQSHPPDTLTITAADVDQSIHEIVEQGGTLTRKLLGQMPTN